MPFARAETSAGERRHQCEIFNLFFSFFLNALLFSLWFMIFGITENFFSLWLQKNYRAGQEFRGMSTYSRQRGVCCVVVSDYHY